MPGDWGPFTPSNSRLLLSFTLTLKLQNLYCVPVLLNILASCTGIDNPEPEFAVMAYYVSRGEI